MAGRLLARTKISAGVRYMLGRFSAYAIFFLGVVASLQTLGINATALTAFGAAISVGIGFGLQDIVKNFVAGIVILIERPFEVGDQIEIDNVATEVAEIRTRSTVLRTNDDVHMVVPNSRFMHTVVNRTDGSLIAAGPGHRGRCLTRTVKEALRRRPERPRALHSRPVGPLFRESDQRPDSSCSAGRTHGHRPALVAAELRDPPRLESRGIRLPPDGNESGGSARRRTAPLQP